MATTTTWGNVAANPIIKEIPYKKKEEEGRTTDGTIPAEEIFGDINVSKDKAKKLELK